MLVSFSIIIVSEFLEIRLQIVGVALVCAVLQDLFSNLPKNEPGYASFQLGGFRGDGTSYFGDGRTDVSFSVC